MFFEDTSFSSLLNPEKELEKGKVFDVVNRVIKDERLKKQKVQPNFPENPFNQPANLAANKSMHPNVSSPLFQTAASNYFNDSNPTDNHRTEKPFRERSPLSDRRSAFGQHSSYMDKPEPYGSLNYPTGLSGLQRLNSPSSISSPNQTNFSNFFTFHQIHQNQPVSSSHQFPEHLHRNNFNAFNQSGFNQAGLNQSPFNGPNSFNLSNPKHRPNAIKQQTNEPTNKAQLPARIWHERPKPSIHTLHPEIWTIIFENLNLRDKGRVAQTCRFFRDIMYSKSVWKGEVARLHLKKRLCSDVLLKCLTRRGIKSVQVSLQYSLLCVRHS